ncbi:MAG: class I SAM-dependent methyltransferase [Gammaproteobacteria bacterium]|nr:class I SAM-dependent methyltransferase [Gammaproteobacteria bacterium]
MYKMYDEIADWWPLLSPKEGYAEEAGFFIKTMRANGLPDSPTLLELGAGGGSNAYYLKQHFAQVTISDLSEKMLAVSQRHNPECEHVVGDMKTIRLNRCFDIVFIHDAIDYMTTTEELSQVFLTTFLHCQERGSAIFVPDHVLETFEESTDHGGVDDEHRAFRFLEWSYDPDESDSTYVTEYVYLLRENGRPLRVEHEQHVSGLFARADWLRLLREAGFEPKIVVDDFARDVFVAYKPQQTT